jgi:hypothetical protein
MNIKDAAKVSSILTETQRLRLSPGHNEQQST